MISHEIIAVNSFWNCVLKIYIEINISKYMQSRCIWFTRPEPIQSGFTFYRKFIEFTLIIIKRLELLSDDVNIFWNVYGWWCESSVWEALIMMQNRRIYKRFIEIRYFNVRMNIFYWKFMQIRPDHNKRGATHIVCLNTHTMSLHHAVIDSQSIIALAIYCNMCTMYSLPNLRCTFGNGVPCHVSHSHRTLHFKWILLFDMFWKDCQSQIKRTRITAKFHSRNEKKCANPIFGQTKTASTLQIIDGKSLVSLQPKIIYGAFYQWKSSNLGIYDNHIENSHPPIRKFFFSFLFGNSHSLSHSKPLHLSSIRSQLWHSNSYSK